MRTREDIEAYLTRSGHHTRELNEDTWLVTDPSDDRDAVVVTMTEGLVMFVPAFLLLVGEWWLLSRIWPPAPEAEGA